MLAPLFAATLRGEITFVTFRRLAAVMELASAKELQTFVALRHAPANRLWKLGMRLSRIGLIEYSGTPKPEDDGGCEITCGPTKLGRLFQTCVGELAPLDQAPPEAS